MLAGSPNATALRMLVGVDELRARGYVAEAVLLEFFIVRVFELYVLAKPVSA